MLLTVLVSKNSMARQCQRGLSLLRWSALVLALLTRAEIRAEEFAQERTLIHDALVSAMVPEQLELRRDRARQQLQSDPRIGKLPPDARERMEAAHDAAYDLKASYDGIAAAVATEFNPEAFAAYIRAMSTPLARKINALLFGVAADPQQQAELRAFLAQRKDHPPPPARTAMLTRLDELTQSSEIRAERDAALFGRLSGIEAGDARFDKYMEKARSEARNLTLGVWLYAFRDLHDEEVWAYVGLYEDPRVARIDQIISRAVLNDELDALQRFLTKLLEMAPTE